MNTKGWQKVIDDTFRMVQKITASKGREYTLDSDDQLANFKRHAQALGVSPELIWAVYFNKHIDAINTFVRDTHAGVDRVRSEPITGRIDDAIVYLLLLKGIMIDRAQQVKVIKNGVESDGGEI